MLSKFCCVPGRVAVPGRVGIEECSLNSVAVPGRVGIEECSLNSVAVPGRVGIEECSLNSVAVPGREVLRNAGMLSRFDFLKRTARLFGILVGDGLFFPIDETKFSKITVPHIVQCKHDL